MHRELWHPEGVTPRRMLIVMVALLTLGLPLAVAAQRGGFFGGGGRTRVYANVPYDGRFTFARIRYASVGRRGGGGWSADYPLMERKREMDGEVRVSFVINAAGKVEVISAASENAELRAYVLRKLDKVDIGENPSGTWKTEHMRFVFHPEA